MKKNTIHSPQKSSPNPNQSDNFFSCGDFKDRLLSRKEAAELLGIKEETLATWKCRSRLKPIPVVKIGSRAKYRLSDLMKYIEARTENTGEI